MKKRPKLLSPLLSLSVEAVWGIEGSKIVCVLMRTSHGLKCHTQQVAAEQDVVDHSSRHEFLQEYLGCMDQTVAVVPINIAHLSSLVNNFMQM